jgi:polyisoprenoid-binding protein YceI
MNFQIPKVQRWLNGVAILGTMIVSQIFAASGGLRQDVVNIDRYSIDNAHTSVVFAISHFGLSYTYGRFNEVEGEFGLTGAELSKAGFSFTIKAASIDTNNAERDKHLRSPDFFDTQQFPEIKFVTKSFTKVDGVYQVVGEMTMLGKTRPLTMPVRLVGIGKGPFGKQRAGYFTKFTIKRSDFGMDKMAGQIGDNISVTFSFEGIKQ